MKLKFFIALTLAMIGLIWACTRDSNDTSNVQGNSFQTDAHLEFNGSNNANETSEATIVVRCEGNCDNGGGACGMHWDLKGNTIECSCSGCKMTLSDSYVAGTTDLGLALEQYKQAFVDFLKTNYDMTEFELTSVEMTRYENARTTLIDFRILNTGQTASVMFVTKLAGTERAADQTIIVDCKATQCDCRERFIASTGVVECTCEKDCTMTVTEVK